MENTSTTPNASMPSASTNPCNCSCGSSGTPMNKSGKKSRKNAPAASSQAPSA